MGLKHKNTQNFEILLIPGKGSRVRKISIPGKWARYLPHALGACAFGVLFTLSLLLFYRHGYVKNQRAQLELNQLHKSMAELQTHLANLEFTFERLSSFDTKLRMMTHLRDPERQLAMGPISPLGQQDLEDSFGSDSPFDEILPYVDSEIQPNDPEEMLVTVKRLQDQSEKREESFVELLDSIRDQEMVLAATPATWPVQGYVTSRFGMRISPFTKQRKFHAGLDIAAAPGTPVYAPGDGTVIFTGTKSGYGQTLIIDHGYGIVTCYAHNSELNVEKGQKVKRGELIAKVGNTGRSTGPHLHYEVRLRGRPSNPSMFILN